VKPWHIALFVLMGLNFHMSHAEENPLLKDAIDAPSLVYWASLGRTESVRQLLSKGANPNAVDAEGWSALQAAAENGHLEVTEMLVRAGADVHYRFAGKTALQSATLAQQERVVKYLKSVGAK
jgi:ankyrin repeat protein